MALDPIPDEPDDEGPLPSEGERRVVEDADARGIAVILQGGETWYIPALPLSPRGLKIAGLIDQLETLEVDSQAASQVEVVAEKRLIEATDDEAIEAARLRLQSAHAKRRQVDQGLRTLHRELAFHALRAHYRVTREEVGRLVTQRHWPDVVAALHGKDTVAAQQEMALALFERLAKAAGKGSAEVPLGVGTGSGGGAAS